MSDARSAFFWFSSHLCAAQAFQLLVLTLLFFRIIVKNNFRYMMLICVHVQLLGVCISGGCCGGVGTVHDIHLLLLHITKGHVYRFALCWAVAANSRVGLTSTGSRFLVVESCCVQICFMTSSLLSCNVG